MREPGVLPRLGIDDGGGDTKAIATAVLMRTLDAEVTAYEEYMNARIGTSTATRCTTCVRGMCLPFRAPCLETRCVTRTGFSVA